MKQVVAWLLRIIFAPVSMVLRTVYTIAAIIIILKVDNVIDVSNYGIPEEYLFIMVVFATIGALLAAIGYRRWAHDKAADTMIEEGKISNQYELAYDKRYDFGTVVGFLIGAVLGIASAPVLVDSFVTGAGTYSYALLAGGAAIAWALIITTLLHFGLRKWLIKAREYAQQIADEAKKTGETLAQVAQDLQPKQ